LGKVYWWAVMYKKITTSDDRLIHIFEDVVDYNFQTKIYNYVKNSLFSITGYDNGIIEQQHLTMMSHYDEKDLVDSGFVNMPEEIKKMVSPEEYHMTDALVNLCKPDDIFHIHSDDTTNNGLTLIYYVNLKWDLEWGGDTVFLNSTSKEIEHTSKYTPGKFVLFDGGVPHLIRPSTRLAPDYRFTLAVRFRRK
jgi:hypothetical protein